MQIVVKAAIDTDALVSLLEDANPDSINGVGADGTSEYEISDWNVDVKGNEFVITVEVERTYGKFASRDEIAAEIEQVIEYVEGVMLV